MFWDDVRVKVQPVIFNDVVSFQAKLSLLSFFFVNDSLGSDPVVAATTHRNSMDVPSDIILDSLEDAIIGLDDQSNVVLLNEAAGHILGCPRMEAIGQPSSRFPALAAVIRQLRLDEPAASGQPGRTCHRLEIHKPETGPVPMEATVSSLLFNGKKFYTIVIRDISRQQQIERALYDSRKTQALGALASGIAHDFNNVLAAVISQIDLVLHTPEFPGTLKDHLVYAQTSARRGAELAIAAWRSTFLPRTPTREKMFSNSRPMAVRWCCNFCSLAASKRVPCMQCDWQSRESSPSVPS